MATGGDAFLGGDDFDNRIIDFVTTEFKSETGIDLKSDVMALQRIKDGAENAKKELSTATETEINLPFITADATGPKHLVQKLTRAKFESLIEDLVEGDNRYSKRRLSIGMVGPFKVKRVGLFYLEDLVKLGFGGKGFPKEG